MKKYIISGTDRQDNKSLVIAKLVAKMYKDEGQDAEIIDLCQLPLADLLGSGYGSAISHSEKMKSVLGKVNAANGLIIICPEYNGSYPGALKVFIDHWQYPTSFEFRPVCFVGLGGRFGGLRPVEHLQQVFGYRNAYIYPERVFLMNIWETLKEDRLTDPIALNLLNQQVRGFCRFTQALADAGLDANSVLAKAKAAHQPK